MSFKSQNLKIVLAPQGQQPKAQAFVDTMRDQAAMGIDANGNQTPYDWRQTGAMLNSMQATQDGKVSVPVRYAAAVNAKRPFLGVAPQMQPVVDQRLQPVIKQFLIFKKGT